MVILSEFSKKVLTVKTTVKDDVTGAAIECTHDEVIILKMLKKAISGDQIARQLIVERFANLGALLNMQPAGYLAKHTDRDLIILIRFEDNARLLNNFLNKN